MRKRTRLGFVLAIAVLAGFFAIPATYAQTVNESEVTATKCATAKEKLATRITKVDATNATQKKVYESLTSKIESLVTSSTANKYEKVTDITTAHENLKKKIDIYIQNATSYTAALNAAKSIECTNGTSEFVEAIATARKDLTATRDSTLDVRKTYKEEAAPALRDYATWLKAQLSSEANE